MYAHVMRFDHVHVFLCTWCMLHASTAAVAVAQNKLEVTMFLDHRFHVVWSPLDHMCMHIRTATVSQSLAVKQRRWQWMTIRSATSSEINLEIPFHTAVRHLHLILFPLKEPSYSDSANLGSVVSSPWKNYALKL